MSFTSINFLYFLIAFIAVYFICPAKYRRYILILSGLIFTAFNSIYGLIVLAVVTLINFLFARWIVNQYNPLNCAKFVAFLNLTALIVFKAVNIMPVGFSFYTFGFISYVIDVGRKEIAPEKNIVKFSSYAFFFPKLLMGPITRYKEVSDNLDDLRIDLKRVQYGLESFALGFIIKVLIADKLAILPHELLKIGYESISTPLAWLGMFGYTLQLYMDWIAYTSMAIGIASLVGVTLPENFDNPFMAHTVSEFYRRWHITLMRFFKDYVYIPLGGNRKGVFRTIRNILIVWLLTGLWHGFSVNYVLWGLSLGIIVVLDRLFLRKAFDKAKVLGHIFVIFYIPFTFLTFMIGDLNSLVLYITRLFPMLTVYVAEFPNDYVEYLKSFAPYLIGGIIFCLPYPNMLLHKYGRKWIVSIIISVVFYFAVFEVIRNGNNPFMYLNF